MLGDAASDVRLQGHSGRELGLDPANLPKALTVKLLAGIARKI
ncbi:hypothetical protein [Chlorobium sp. N1]|nr:hypothetical protein [Chlorobium sp. N1]